MVSELQQAPESCDSFVGHAGRKQPRPKEGQTCSEAQTCCDQRGDDGARLGLQSISLSAALVREGSAESAHG